MTSVRMLLLQAVDEGLDDQKSPFLLLGLTLFVFILMLLMAIAAWQIVGPWLQSITGGAPITTVQLLGMKLRGINIREVVQCGVMARQADCTLAWDELERASLEGANLEKVTLAYIQSQRDRRGFSFAELVDGDRRDRLSEMLGQSAGSS